MTARWWWGTYPEAGHGTPTGLGEGLWAMTPGGSKASLVLEIPSPSFIVAHPDLPILYMVTEEAEATVSAVDVTDPASPILLGRVPTGGRDACHLLLARDTLALYAAHYTSGDLAVVPLRADGSLVGDERPRLLGHEGSGPHAIRQKGPHAHFIGYAPGSGWYDTLLVADLGTDELRRCRFAFDCLLVADGVAATLPPGAGPRHFAVRGDRLYVTCELDHQLRTLRWNAETRTAELEHETPSTLVEPRSRDTLFDGHVAVVGDTLLVSVRGADVISVFDLDSEGRPELRASFDSGGVFPRHFAVVGETLVVANQESHLGSRFDLADVLSLEVQDDPAAPAELPHRDIPIPSPACVCAA